MANYFEDFDFTDFWEDSGYAKPAAKGVRLFPADPHDAGDGHMILRPTGGLFPGMWWTPQNKLAYMEPLCTIPKYF